MMAGSVRLTATPSPLDRKMLLLFLLQGSSVVTHGCPFLIRLQVSETRLLAGQLAWVALQGTRTILSHLDAHTVLLRESDVAVARDKAPTRDSGSQRTEVLPKFFGN